MTKTDYERLDALDSEKVSTKSEYIFRKRTLKTAHGESPKKLLRYWEEAIYQRGSGGKWWIQIQHEGRRERFTLGTRVRAAAAEKAREIYQSLLATGWDDVLAVYRPEKIVKREPTFGDFEDEVKSKADLKAETCEGYFKSLRQIAADIFAIDGGRAKYDYRQGGREKWLTQIRAIRLADWTPAKTQAWKRAFLARAGADPIAIRTAKISCSTILRTARSLFSKKVLRHLELELPSPLPFEGVELEKRQSMQYRSSFKAEELVRAASKELAKTDPPAFLVVVLALCCGLRKLEIDLLPWSAVDFDRGIIRIEPTEYFDVKTEHSIGDVPVDPEVLALLRGFHAKALGDFVIESSREPRPSTTYSGYRCHTIFKRVYAWLKAKGVKSQKPLHDLRKEYGSIINAKFDLVTAKELLRHSSVAITASHYVENRKRGVTGLGVLLKPKVKSGKKIVEFKDAAKASNRAARAKTPKPTAG